MRGEGGEARVRLRFAWRWNGTTTNRGIKLFSLSIMLVDDSTSLPDQSLSISPKYVVNVIMYTIFHAIIELQHVSTRP